MIGEETYEGESHRLKFKTKDGIKVEVVTRWGQVRTELGTFVVVDWFVVTAKFRPKICSRAKMVYINKMRVEDFVAKRNEIVEGCQKEEYTKAVNKKIRNKEDRINEFKNKHMLHDVGDEWLLKGIERANLLTFERILDESPLFATFVRDFKK